MTVACATVLLLSALQLAPTLEVPPEAAKSEEVFGTLGPPPCPPACTVDQAIHSAAMAYGVSEARLSCLARRESTMNPGAVNGQYGGLFQFNEGTFALTPYAQYGRFNAYASAQGAAFLIARGEGSRWPPLSQC